MTLYTKCGVLLLAAVGGWAMSEFDLVARAPQETTSIALRQLQNSDAAADQLRQADAAKNGWLVFWPVMLVVLAGLLFWDDVMRICGPRSTPPDAPSSPSS
jgi:hypothetical protein